jgi:hypothetical protein
VSRTAIVDRNTAETNFHLKLALDGSGQSDISTAVPFMDHMLTHVTRHGFFDLTVQGTGDTQIDDHHTVEDLGICLGKAFRMALADKSGIRRYGQGSMPMHEALVSVHIDFSGRPVRRPASFIPFRVDAAEPSQAGIPRPAPRAAAPGIVPQGSYRAPAQCTDRLLPCSRGSAWLGRS